MEEEENGKKSFKRRNKTVKRKKKIYGGVEKIERDTVGERKSSKGSGCQLEPLGSNI